MSNLIHILDSAYDLARQETLAALESGATDRYLAFAATRDQVHATRIALLEAEYKALHRATR